MQVLPRLAAAVLVAVVVAMAGPSVARDERGSDTPPAAPSHIMVAPGDVKWADGPPSLPAGAKFAVVEGDPSKPGLFTMRLKVPGDYQIPAHWHPADEHVTVLSGAFHMGLGDKLDTAKGHEMPAGSFVVMAAQTRHFAFTRQETVIQLHGVGPWGINYVDPADDPRKKK